MGSAASSKGVDPIKNTSSKTAKTTASKQKTSQKSAPVKKKSGKTETSKTASSKSKTSASAVADDQPSKSSSSPVSKTTASKQKTSQKSAPVKKKSGKTETSKTASSKSKTSATAVAAKPQNGSPITDQLPKSSLLATSNDTAAAHQEKNDEEKPVIARYEVGQEIVYPLQGVGKIQKLEEIEFQNKPTLYYVVYLEVSDMKIMIPVGKADELGVRAIVSKRKAENALRLISEDFDPIPTDWKLRYQMNLDLLKRGAVEDIASVVRTLFYRSKIKELPILERKLYDSAHRLLIDEVSFSLGKDRDAIEQLIEERLAKVKQKGDPQPE